MIILTLFMTSGLNSLLQLLLYGGYTRGFVVRTVVGVSGNLFMAVGFTAIAITRGIEFRSRVIEARKADKVLTELRESQRMTKRSIRVLIVDDDTSVTESLRNVLLRIDLEKSSKDCPGLEIYTAQTGNAALKIFEAAKIHVVICDIVIDTILDGNKLCDIMRDEDPTVWMIAFTGFSDTYSLSACIAGCFDDYFVKPLCKFFDMYRSITTGYYRAIRLRNEVSLENILDEQGIEGVNTELDKRKCRCTNTPPVGAFCATRGRTCTGYCDLEVCPLVMEPPNQEEIKGEDV
jgi:CheY-like chemotaxis protein